MQAVSATEAVSASLLSTAEPISGRRREPDTRCPLEVPLIVACARRSPGAEPVTVGVPLPRGFLTQAGAVGLFDHAGRQVTLQSLPLAHWPDGSVKWLLLDFIADELSGDAGHWALRQLGPGLEQGLPGDRLRVTESPA